MDIVKTKKRVITRRAVLWLGQICNQRCYFCYFINRITDGDHPEHAFMSLGKAKAICTTVRNFYGCTAIDIQGGEPTIHPDILELVAHCRGIGLYPTLITNGLVLARPGVLRMYKEAGIRDFLVSLHGVGEVHDQVVGRQGAYADIAAAIGGMRELDIPFRFNCTMSEPVIPLLPDIARKAIETGAYAANFIAFNPFGDQVTGVRTARNVPRYSAIREPLTAALDLLEAAGIEANVRYLPLCMAEERHRKSFYNFQQLPYDTHEWDYPSWLWTMMQSQMMRGGDPAPPFRMGPYARRLSHQPGTRIGDLAKRHPIAAALFFGLQRLAGAGLMGIRGRDALYRREARLRAALDCRYRFHDACMGCALKGICDGFHGDYADLFGTDEARPVTGTPPVRDPRHFIRHQEKVVEPEDRDWAL